RRGVIVFGFRIKCGGIGVTGFDHFRDADNARRGAIGVVKENLIANFNLIAQHVAGLVIADAIPVRDLFWFACEGIDAEGFGFGFEEPVVHGGSFWMNGGHAALCPPYKLFLPPSPTPSSTQNVEEGEM